MLSEKVFCIGFHKTGTKSLGRALEMLGYRVCGPVEIHNPLFKEAPINNVKRYLKSYNAFNDNPWAILYSQLDELYPASKFILTVRHEQDWITSVVNNFGTIDTPMREWIYGVGHPLDNESVYLQCYAEHNISVVKYFEQRQQDLLIMNITQDDGWSVLCPFLDRPIPNDEPFPNIVSRPR